MRAGLLIGILVLVAASLWTAPVKSAVPGAPLLAGNEVPPEVRAILDRSCRDCHSELTRYPWYSYVAPVSLLIRRDVTAGRARLNLSRWGDYTPIRRMRFLSEIANQVKDREMPLPAYTLIHRNARLSDSEVQTVFRWTQTERLRLLTSAPSQ
jgi:Haem-binding domain